MKILLSLLLLFSLLATSRAELRIIGIKITQEKDKKPTVSIFSEVETEKRKGISIEEAATILSKAQGWKSSVVVGIEAYHIPLSSYLPILKSISENSWLDLGFVEGQEPNFLFKNIKGMIEPALPANPSQH